MREDIFGFGEDQEHSKIGQNLVLVDKKRGLFLSFVIDIKPPLNSSLAFTGFLRTPADCIVRPALFKQMSV